MESDSKNAKNEDDETLVLKAIADMSDQDRIIGERLHKIITAAVTDLVPRTWYGMPAYTLKTEDKGDKILCFFRSRQKFGERYMTLGFNDVANLDDGSFWPISYAITKLTDDDEKRITELVKKAANKS